MSRAKVDGSKAPAFFDDAEREVGRNGLAATGRIMGRIAKAINQAAHAGRPFFSFVIRSITGTNPVLRQVYSGRNLGTSFEAGAAIYTQHQLAEDVEGFVSGQGIQVTIDGVDYLTEVSFDLGNADTTSGVTYPNDSRTVAVFSGAGYSADLAELVVEATTENYPQIRGMSLWQPAIDSAPTSSSIPVGTSDLHQKGEIVGVRASSNEHLGTFLSVFRNTWYYQRPQLGWSLINPGTNYLSMTTSRTQFRYVFDQAYGTGGTSFTGTGPALTLPLMHSAASRRNQIRVYVFVYAAMSGTTNTGTIGVANRDTNADMATSASALTNGATISGTSFQWYPSPGSFNPATSPYFLGYAGSIPDRVALCARSSGATDAVRIAAWTMIVQHSVA